MTTQQRKPAPKPAPLGRTDQEIVQRLPMFGPGLKIRIPLNPPTLWLVYQKAYSLEVLAPNPDPEARTKQDVVYVRRVPRSQRPAPSAITWRCMECINQPEMLQPDMIVHMREVHQIDAANVTGIKNLVMRTDAAGVYRPAFEWTINGMTFLCYEPMKEKQ